MSGNYECEEPVRHLDRGDLLRLNVNWGFKRGVRIVILILELLACVDEVGQEACRVGVWGARVDPGKHSYLMVGEREDTEESEKKQR